MIEKSDRIGGRVRSISLHGKRFEAGASILHSSNRYAEKLCQELGLSHRKSDPMDKDPGLLAIFDGKEFVISESESTIITLYRFARRYGMDMFRIQSLIHQMIEDFSRIYVYQNNGIAFSHVDDLLSAMNYKFPALLRKTFYDHLLNASISSLTAEELVQAISIVNYGQEVRNMHAFVGSVSSAGADFTGSTWNIDGGNERLPQLLTQKSGAKVLLNTDVQHVELLSNGSFVLKDSNHNEMVYDAVIIAHPLSLSEIQFHGFTPDEVQRISNEKQMGKYQRTVATFVSGKRSGNYSVPGVSNIIVSNEKFFFHSIGRLHPVSTEGKGITSDVFKIFSSEPLTQDQLSVLFDRIDDVHVVDWNAYPHYYLLHDRNPVLRLRDGLIYVNAIEWAASAMEMSLIGGRNAALLTHNFLIDQSNEV